MRESRPFDLRLFLMAVGAGAVDVVSLTTLGAFTAAVTANMVFIGIAIEDGDTHTAIRAGLAVAFFGAGAFLGTRALARVPAERRRSAGAAVLWGIAGLQAVFLVIWLATSGEPDGAELDLLALVSACAMGGQTALTGSWHTGVMTTYVSGSLVGLLGAVASPGSPDPEWRNQIGVIIALLVGALIGAVLLSQARDSVPVLPLALTVVVAGATLLRVRRAA
jgi:uncharacterized membrane protein YoaK (UPF0700 family)